MHVASQGIVEQAKPKVVGGSHFGAGLASSAKLCGNESQLGAASIESDEMEYLYTETNVTCRPWHRMLLMLGEPRKIRLNGTSTARVPLVPHTMRDGVRRHERTQARCQLQSARRDVEERLPERHNGIWRPPGTKPACRMTTHTTSVDSKGRKHGREE